MCSFCEELYNNKHNRSACNLGKRNRTTVGTNEKHELQLSMIRTAKNWKIVRGEMIHDLKVAEPMTYLKAIRFDTKNDHTTALYSIVEIKYCPFCGEKLH